jgi:hypothetical protein
LKRGSFARFVRGLRGDVSELRGMAEAATKGLELAEEALKPKNVRKLSKAARAKLRSELHARIDELLPDEDP